MKRWLIVFAKEPEKGKVKTRLAGSLSEEKCVELYKEFLLDTVIIAGNVPCEKRVLAFEAGGEPEFLKSISDSFELYRQEGADLGDKMHNAFEYARRGGAEAAVIIGSDSPTLPEDFVVEAFKRLEDHDVVISPAYDGGYYLVGLKEPCAGLFQGISWSSPSVLTDTIRRADRLGKSVSLLDKWHDIDTIEDIDDLEDADKYRRIAGRQE